MADQPLRITELDYLSIRENLKAFLRNQSEFSDFDFEGSGMAVILDLLAYNTHYMAMNLNLVGNEMFLDTAQIRSSVISLAKLTNYVPTSKVAATAKVNITVTPTGSEPNTVPTITLNRYTRFLADPISGISYNFLSVNANTAVLANGSYLFSNVVIRQGEALSSTFLVDQNNPSRRFILGATDSIDTSTLRVSIQDSEANTTLTTYNEADDITEITANSTVYFIEENPAANGSHTLYFGDGILGKNPSNGNIVIANYIATQGPIANKARVFTAINGISGYSNVAVSTTVNAYGGSERESIESIRYRAPVHYTTQNRAVNDTDYEAIILKEYPNIESVSVWGGKDNVPPIYGKVFIAMKPVDDYYITIYEKEQIKNDIIANHSVLTVFPEIVDPEYTYITLKTKVHYNKSNTTLDGEEIKTLVRVAILDYREKELKKFGAVFRKSKLQKYINDAHESITGCDISAYLQKRVEPILNQNQAITLNFNTSLYKAGSINKLFSYPEVVVVDVNGVQRRINIEEVPDSYTGIDSIIVVLAGTNYTSTPTVTITGDGTGATAVANIVNRKLNNIVITNRGSNYSRAVVSITGGNGSGATATVELQARNGTLRTFYYRTTTGEKIIVNALAGTIDYSSGELTLTSFEPLSIITNTIYDENVLTVSVQPEEDTVKALRSSILDIDANDISSISIEVTTD